MAAAKEGGKGQRCMDPYIYIGSASVPVDAPRCTSAQYAARLNNLAPEEIFRSVFCIK